MAHFYGGVKGQRGEATRLGNKQTGLRTFAASYQGKVSVELHAKDDGVDYASVWLEPHLGRGSRQKLYEGPVGGPQAPEANPAVGEAAGVLPRLVAAATWRGGR